MMTITEEITLGNMIEKIAALIPQGYRFVTMTVVDSETHFDIYYHFDLNYELTNLWLKLGREESLPSISGVCSPALVIENEIQDLFGIRIDNLEMDYQSNFLLSADAPARPFCRVPGVGVEIVEEGGAK